MNSVNLIGRLTSDPQLRHLQNGTAVANFTLAVDKQLSKEQRETLESNNKPTADFIRIVVWGKQAESSAKYLAKGRLVAVQGRIQTGSYEKDGVRHYTTDVIANQVQFLEWKNKDDNQDDYVPDGFQPTDSDSIPF